jgi:chloramphenicol-sensitive protein RarD
VGFLCKMFKMNKGYLAAFAAYLFWGFSPIYWKIVAPVPAIEVLASRIIWAVPFLLLVLFIRRDFSILRIFWKSPWKYKGYLLTPFLLAGNWLVWIWSVSNGYVVDASLGYFINPLINVVMGVVLLHEHLRRGQWISLFLALIGVLYLTLNYGQFPWIALTLACTFALYGFIRKTAALGAVNGLTVEISVLLIPSIILLFYLHHLDLLTLPSQSFEMHSWLVLAGVITVFPLSVFAYGARKIPYSTLGFIQYIAPTFQFLLGVYLFKEAFSIDKFIGFSFIWFALILYSIENIYFHRMKKISRS